MTDPVDEPREEAHSLVLPFVVVESAGGQYDDEAFAVGWDCGALYAELDFCKQLDALPPKRWMKPGALVQADLIAMDRGFTMVRGDADPGSGWVVVSFGRQEHVCGVEG